ncbi:MAG: metallophosphoesterase [Actinomycetia bacterium]|nr:metallophosphoesterase [Actinomycetes bacterium]
MLRFVVIADSHIRPEDQETDAYPSNALLIRRNELVVQLCNTIEPAFIVHLGDIVHPLPVEDAHDVALGLAGSVYDGLKSRIYFVAGNHDVGDKPNAHVAVPAVSEENYPRFEATWGPSYMSFDAAGHHFVIVDAQVMNSGLERERAQVRWLEADLADAHAAGKRSFVFMHYPPFVRDADENEHYDNIGEPARSWFLSQVVASGVEAVFSGHVHNFMYNQHGATEMYVAPSTGFVRPDYAELAALAPVWENGRDDPAKLGIFVVDIDASGHQIRPVRSFGEITAVSSLPVDISSFLDPGWSNPLGVTLSHSWTSITDFPTAGLDAYARKRIRNDATLLSLWEARIESVRIPLDDLATDEVIDRVRQLVRRGMHFSVYSAGPPRQNLIDLVRSASTIIDRWEISAVPQDFEATIAAVGGAGVDVDLAMAPIVPIGTPGDGVHHFVISGFATDNIELISDLDRADSDQTVSELVFRIDQEIDVDSGVVTAIDIARRFGRRAVVLVRLPLADESETFDDDQAVSDRVVEAAVAAMVHQNCSILIDGFMDHDRGYYPRHGLVDRHLNPRGAFYRLISTVSRGREDSGVVPLSAWQPED